MPREREVLLSQRAHTPLSLLSLSLSLSLSLGLSLSLSVHLLCLASGREELHFQLTHIFMLLLLILHASIAEITAQLLSLSYVYLIL